MTLEDKTRHAETRFVELPHNGVVPGAPTWTPVRAEPAGFRIQTGASGGVDGHRI
jgi:hypothetical protein